MLPGARAFLVAAAVCGSTVAIPVASSAVDDIAIANTGSHRIVVLNLSPADSGVWGPDRLGSEVLEPGEYIRLPFNDYRNCLQDVRAIYEDRHVVQTRVNACTNNLTFNY